MIRLPISDQLVALKRASAALVVVMASVVNVAEGNAETPDWPAAIKTIEIRSSKDGSLQPTMMYSAEADEPRPLLVALHSWSSNYLAERNGVTWGKWAMQNGFHYLHPNFRGANWTPDAMGSDLAVQDIVDAVAYMKKNYPVDANRIYLLGSSGGGHMALLMAGRHPEIWAGVSAWVPISDVHAWWEVRTQGGGRQAKYARNIEEAVGGSPGEDKAAKDECRKRSPVTWLPNAARVNLDINHGVHDGRQGSVPFVHSLHAFNAVVPGSAKIPEDAIHEFYATQKLPAGLEACESDPLYGTRVPIFRKVHKNTRITIFEGGHEIIHDAALQWLAAQRKDEPAMWDLQGVNPVQPSNQNFRSGL